MGRQLFQDGPFVDPQVVAPTALTANTIQPLWVAARYTPVFANDPKAGKIYCVRAGGLITNSSAGSTLIITPKYGTGGTTLGASPAQLVPVMTAIVWTVQAELVFTIIGAPGTNSTAVMAGTFTTQGTIGTAGTGTVIPFGGTVVANLDASILANIEINTTFSAGTNSTQPLFAYIFTRN